MEIVSEQWKPLNGEFAGWPFEASNLGRIRRVGGEMFKGRLDRWGYIVVCVRHAGISKNRFAHRLVLSAFHRVPVKGEQCNHKNGDKGDNRIENLEWVSCKENARHAMQSGLRPKPIGRFKRKLTLEQAAEIRRNGKSSIKLAAKYGVTTAVLREIISGKTYKTAV